MGEQPKDGYETPQVEQVDAADTPAVTAAGEISDQI
jgi:hypothetical protein